MSSKSSEQPKIDELDRTVEQQQFSRVMPNSDIDLQMMTLDSVWGKPDVPYEVKSRLAKDYLIRTIQGKMIPSTESLWGILGFYTRDMRLANLSVWDNELKTVRYWLDLASDCIICDLKRPAAIALSRAANIMETSQSKGGFLRRNINTFRKEEVKQELEPPKKGFWGGKKEG